MPTADDITAAIQAVKVAGSSVMQGAKPPKRLMAAVETLTEEVASSWDGPLYPDLLTPLRNCALYDDDKLQPLVKHLVSLYESKFMEAPPLHLSQCQGMFANNDREILIGFSRLERGLAEGLIPGNEMAAFVRSFSNLKLTTPTMKAHAVSLARYALMYLRSNDMASFVQGAREFLIRMVEDPVPNIALPAIGALADGGFMVFVETAGLFERALSKYMEVMNYRRRVHSYSCVRSLVQFCRTSRYQEAYLPPQFQACNSPVVAKILHEMASLSMYSEVRFASLLARIWFDNDLSYLAQLQGKFTAAVKRQVLVNCRERINIDKFAPANTGAVLRLATLFCTDFSQTSSTDADFQPIVDIFSATADKAPAETIEVLVECMCSVLSNDVVPLRLRESVLWLFGRYSDKLFVGEHSLENFRRVYFLIRAQSLHADKTLTRSCVRTLMMFASFFVHNEPVFREVLSFILLVPELKAFADVALLRELHERKNNEDVMRRIRVFCGVYVQ